MKRFLIVTLGLAIFLQSCKQIDTRDRFYNEQGLLVRRKFYPDGSTVLLERTYKNDSIEHGYAKKFYRSGEPMIYAEYADGQKNGKQISYYLNGAIEEMGFFKKGKEDSVWYWYDSLGRITDKESFVNGYKCGNSYKYYSNGKMKTCYFNSPGGGWVFKTEYDSVGVVKSKEGDPSPIVVFVTTHKNDQWKAGEEFKARVYIDQCNTRSEVELQFKEAKSNKIISSEKLNATDGVIHYSKTLDKVGDYFFNVMQDKSGLVNKTEIRVEK